MTASVVSRVVAEIYQGVEFPTDWVDKPETISVGMARDTLISVAAYFDAETRPLAACWCIAGGDERFVLANFADRGESSLLNELDRDLAQESLRIGASDLLATLIWEPGDLRQDQGQNVHKLVFQSGRSSVVTGWNIPPRELVANANKLLVLTRRADNGLALPTPASAEDMHRALGESDPHLMIVLPGDFTAAKVGGRSDALKLAYLLGALLLAGLLISACVLKAS